MAITTLSMVLTVFVLNLHHVTDRPVPHWVKRFVLVYLAKVMCMTSYGPKTFDDDEDEENKRDDKYRVTANSLGKSITDQIGILTGLNGSNTNGKASATTASPSTSKGLRFNTSKKTYSYAPTSDKEKEDPKKKEEEYAKEWRKVAEVVDRLFFWLFLIAIVVTTLLLFHPLTKASKTVESDEEVLK